MIGIESIKSQHPAHLPRGSRHRKREFNDIVYYLMTSLPSLRPGEHDFDHIMTDASGIGKSDDGGDDDSGYWSSPGLDTINEETSQGDGGFQTLHTPPPSPPSSDSDSTEDQPHQLLPHHQGLPFSTLNEPTFPHPRKFSFVWVNMADEIHGCNSYDSYHLIAALNRLGLGGRRYSSNSTSTDPPPPPLFSHLPSFRTQIRQLFALDKRQREIWDIEMLYIPSDESRDQRTVLLVGEHTWEGIKGLIGRDADASFEWRIYTYRNDKSARLDPGGRVFAGMRIIGDKRKKKKGVKFVSRKSKDGPLALLNRLGDGELKRRRIG